VPRLALEAGTVAPAPVIPLAMSFQCFSLLLLDAVADCGGFVRLVRCGVECGWIWPTRMETGHEALIHAVLRHKTRCAVPPVPPFCFRAFPKCVKFSWPCRVMPSCFDACGVDAAPSVDFRSTHTCNFLSFPFPPSPPLRPASLSTISSHFVTVRYRSTAILSTAIDLLLTSILATVHPLSTSAIRQRSPPET
jgi:hypothetical protein